MAIWQNSSRNEKRSANNFSQALTTELSPFFTDENAMIDGYGWDFDEFPAIKTRKGMSYYGPLLPSRSSRFLTTFGSLLVRITGNRIQYNNMDIDNAWTEIPGTYGSETGLWTSSNFDINGDALILLNSSSGGFYLKNNTVTSIPQMPRGLHITSDNLRVYVANVTSPQGEFQGDYIYYSGYQDAMDFTSANNSGTVQFYTPSGGEITGIHSFGGAIWVFKREAYAIIYHTGDSTLAYRLTAKSDTIGCPAPKTIAEVGPYIIFLSKDDVYIGNGDSVLSIGGPIKRFLKRMNVNEAILRTSFAYGNGQKYYLFIPLDNAGYPNACFVYDLRFQRWLPYTFTAPFLTDGTVNRTGSYTVDFRSQVYKMDSADTDYNGPIPWMIQSRPFDEGVKEAEKELWEMHLLGRFPSTSTMNVQISPRDDTTEWYSLEYDPIGTSPATQNKNLIVPLDTMPLCHYYSYRLSGTGDVTIQEVQRYSRIQPVQY